jgi:(S)-2-hydroxyglutarate dehydrogenase
MTRVLVVGAGIVGLAVADRLAGGGHQVTVLEKEPEIARHQTGRNSGVIHSGLDYAPGSHKARMCVRGARGMTAFARAHGVRVDTCGKLVVAVDDGELPGLRRLLERGRANGVPVEELDAAGARDVEPAVSCRAALRVRSTGIVDFVGVATALAVRVLERGGEIRTGTAVRALVAGDHEVVAGTDGADVRADVLVNCAGLHSDRVAAMAGLVPEARIVPFRGEYYTLRAGREHLVRAMVYPVPDPRFPFLGVHLTRTVDGRVHAGPNAVPALAREGYTWRDVRLADAWDAVTWPGLWRLAVRNAAPAVSEVRRSLSRRRFAASLARIVPAVTSEDLVPAPSGVRAQAVTRNGFLVDDFLIQTGRRQVHVLNAPSPAATAALEIAEHVARVVGAVA